MEWEEPKFAEISLACEVSGYANAELAELEEAHAQGAGNSGFANDER